MSEKKKKRKKVGRVKKKSEKSFNSSFTNQFHCQDNLFPFHPDLLRCFSLTKDAGTS